MSHLDTAQLIELKEIMEDAFDDLVSTYLDDSSEKLTKLEAAITAQDTQEVSSLAHSLKGSSSNICASGLAEKFKVLEDMGRAGDVSQGLEALVDAKAVYGQVEDELKSL